MPAADSAPGECFSVAHYRLLHHTAVSFVSSDISRRHDVIKTLKRANLMPAADSAPGECFSVAHYRLCFTTPPFPLWHLTSEFL